VGSCATCGQDTRPGARFCSGCGSPLPAGCAACGADLRQAARFCERCGAPVAAATEAVRKTISVVFGDLVGSTALQETLDPESTRRVMARFYDVVRGAVAEHAGEIHKFVGDGVLAIFGTPVVREDDALRAVRCAAAMIAGLEALGDELERDVGVRMRLRVGVNTGELVVSGDGELVGDAMNTAARFEQAAAPGEVLISESTRRLVRDHVELEELPRLTLKGKADPVRAWRVRATTGAETVRAEASLVGRSRELARLRAGLADAVAARACRLVTVIGSPGIGKSRLLAEFASVVRDEAAVLVGHCEPSGEGITFLPIAEVLRQVAGIAEADSPEVVRDKLLATIEGDPDAERIAEHSAAILGVGKVASPEETFWALRRGLESLARRRPVVVVLDDVHWAQPMLLDLVEHLVEWVTDAPVLLVALARPELREAREALTATPGRPLDVIELSPFDSAESLAFVAGLLGDAELPDALRRRILETTEGNPLFLGELVRMLVDDGFLRQEQGRWVTTAAPEEVEVPPTIQALLAARIERLDADERSVIERAAVIGKQFYRGAVAELVAAPVATVIDAHLEMLRRKEMVQPEGTYWIDEPVYRFHHVLIRDAAYRALLKEARSELHERFARWLEEKAGEAVGGTAGEAGGHEEVIAFHLEQAHEYRRELGQLDDRGRALGAEASARLASAGRRALARDDLAAAANLLERALRRLDDCDETERAEVLLDLGEALLSAGDTAGAEQRVAELRGLAGSSARLSGRAEVLDGQIATLTGGADIDATIELVRAAADTLRDAGDRAGEAKAHHVLAQAQALLGRVAAVEESLDRALAAARASDDRRRVTAILAAAPRAALWGPSPVVRASGRCLDVVRILRMTPGNRHVEAIALRCQAVLEAMRGRTQAARDILAAGRATLEELGLTLELQETAVHAGIVELLAGDPVAAETHLRAAVDGFTALGVDRGAAQASALLARSLVDQHRHDEAVAATEDAERRGGGDLKTSITWCGVRAEALARSGRIDEALVLAQRAVDLAEPTDALPDKAEAWMSLATVYVLGDQEREAREAAAHARELYAAKDHGVGLLRATTIAGGTGAPDDEATVPPHAAEPHAPAGDLRPPERILAGWTRLFAAGDADAVLALAAPDSVMRDRRTLGYTGLVSGIQEHADLVRSMIAEAKDLRFEVDEVLACDNRVVAARTTFHGHGRHAGPFEIPTGLIVVARGDRWSLTEIFDSDDRDAMLTRFAELRGAGAPIADPELAAFFARFAELWAQRDVAAIADAYPEDLLGVDHRRAGWGDVRGRAGVERQVRSVLDISSDIRFCVDEVLAARDGAAALRVAWRGRSADTGGELESPLGWVARVDGERMTSLDFYEPDDREAMLARFAELTGAMLPPERFFRDISSGDVRLHLGELSEVYADDFVMVDHRAIGWEETHGHEGLQRAIGAVEETWPDLSATVDEVLACDDRVIAFGWTWYGHANDDSGGGEMQLPIGVVAVVDDGRWASTDFFDPDDRASMLARYAELTRATGREARVLAEYTGIVERGDLDAMAALVTDDYVMVDHRQMGWDEVRGPAGAADLLASAKQNAPDMRFRVNEALAQDEHAIAVRGTWFGDGVHGAAAWEITAGLVWGLEHGLFSSLDLYEPDDVAAVLARYAERGGGAGPLGDRRPEQVVKAFIRAYAAGDLDGMASLVADDWVLRDHRSLGWEELRGREGFANLMRSALRAARNPRLEVDEVLACDDRVIAFSATFVGSNVDGGGPFRWPIGFVIHRAGMDLFDPDDRAAMLARFAELGGGTGPLGDRRPEQVVKAFLRAYAARDVDGVIRGVGDDWAIRDHRPLGWEEMRGREGAARFMESIYSVTDSWGEVDEVVACSDRVIAVRCTFHHTPLDGGGAASAHFGLIFGRHGVDVFDPDDRDGMLAHYAELTAHPRESERMLARMCEAYAARDADTLLALWAPTVEQRSFVDHRAIGHEPPRDRAELGRYFRSIVAAPSELELIIDEVLACDDHVVAASSRFVGRGVGAGDFEIPLGGVWRVEDGLATACEMFEADDRAGMIAAYGRLGGGTGVLGDRPPERAMAGYVRAFDAHDLERALEFFADDWVMVDHRPLAWEELRGKEAASRLLRSGFAGSDDMRLEVDEVLACDDDVIAVRIRHHGTDERGGAYELAAGWVMGFEDGAVVTNDLYAADDREAMLARFAELTGDRGRRRTTASDDAFNRRDTDAMAATYAQDIVLIDHRVLGWERFEGRAAALEQTASMWRHMSDDVQVVSQEMLARDGRAFARVFSFRGLARDGGGELELALGQVGVRSGDLIERLEWFEPNDRQAMIARYAELGGGQGPLGDRPPERLVAEWMRRYAARDVEDILALYREDWTAVDRRAIASEPADLATEQENLRLQFALPLIYMEIEEVLAVVERAVALSCVAHGRSMPADGGGPFEFRFASIVDVEDGRFRRFELFEPEDRAAVLARFAELTGERIYQRFDRLYDAKRADALAALYTDDLVVVDHRSLGWEELHGPQAMVELCRGMMNLTSDPVAQTTPLEDDGGPVLLLRFTGSGTGSEIPAGTFEIAFDLIMVLRGEQCERIELFERDDPAARTRCEELRAKLKA